MRITSKQRMEVLNRLSKLGVSFDDGKKLRRISMTLQRWFEMECGSDNGCIERDEKTGKPFWYNANSRFLTANDPRAYSPIPDREKGAMTRLEKIMKQYPALVYYVQSDCRGASLYILERNKVNGENLDSIYSSYGVAVY